MKLYDMSHSGNCYKIRLFLSLIQIDYTLVPVNVAQGEHKTEAFLKMNPNGLLPILQDSDLIIYDSATILVYLAKRYADTSWLPDHDLELANVVRWLAFEQSEGRYGMARARAKLLKLPSPLTQMGSLEEAQNLANQGLDMMNTQLSQNRWLAGGKQPSIADIACYPYTTLSNEGGLSPAKFPAIKDWMQRIESLELYTPPLRM